MNQALISLFNVTKTYGRGDVAVNALNGVTLEIRAGELVAVMGASGSGKSTLLTIAGGLEKPTDGSVTVAGIPVQDAAPNEISRLRRQTIGFVFQDFNLIPALSVLENVSLPLELDGVARRKAKRAAIEALEAMGIESLQSRFPDEISGGQRQRVAIARSFVGPRRVILADEPTGALDSRSSEVVIRALRSRIDLGAAGLLVTHDAKCAAWADRILTLRDGAIIQETSTSRKLDGLQTNA